MFINFTINNKEGINMDRKNKALDFTLQDQNGKEFFLSKENSKYIVLYFYPKDDTPGCTLEGQEFSAKNTEFLKLKTRAIGISGGSEESKKKFCEKYKLRIPLLADPEFKVAKQYKVYGEKTFMGNVTLGIRRTTFILDKNKEIIKTFSEVKPLGHAQEVLNFIKNLG